MGPPQWHKLPPVPACTAWGVLRHFSSCHTRVWCGGKALRRGGCRAPHEMLAWSQPRDPRHTERRRAAARGEAARFGCFLPRTSTKAAWNQPRCHPGSISPRQVSVQDVGATSICQGPWEPPPIGWASSGRGAVPRAMGSSWRRAQRGWRGRMWGSPSSRSCSTAVYFLLQSYAAPAGVPAAARSGAAAVRLTCCPPAGDSPSPPSAPGSPAASPPSCGPRTSTCPAARPAPGDTRGDTFGEGRPAWPRVSPSPWAACSGLDVAKQEPSWWLWHPCPTPGVFAKSPAAPQG